MTKKSPPSDLPSGTVTFLFTDIQDSTMLWEQNPRAMQVAVAQHDEALREAIETREGYIFKTAGDSFCAAFATAQDALSAAGAAQRSLLSRDSPLGKPLRVRMALHTGTAEQRGGDYFGPSLNRAARLLAAAHGGQVLLSRSTYDLVLDTLGEGESLRNLGLHRMSGLAQPERIFQLVAPDLPASFPPIDTPEARPHNLPSYRTRLIGRDGLVADAKALLLGDDVSLLTLTGTAGTGKTRLGVQVAAELLEHFESGVYFVDLAAISDPELVRSAISQVLGVKDTPARPLPDSLSDFLRDKQLLLILDNFEQVLAAAHQVDELLAISRRLKIVVTSRESLHLRGERELPVPPLALPDVRWLPPLDSLAAYAAVNLFTQRAQDVRPDFRLTSENALAVARICLRLDGIPLAIELAAARVKFLPPAAILTRLERPLPVLTGGPRDLPARQQTLRSAIAWSYDLLDADQGSLFRRLSVFVSGATLEAVEAVMPPNFPSSLDAVASLVDKSLLQQKVALGGEPRFSMLETIREFATEQLEADAETAEARSRHAGFYLALAEEAEKRLSGAEQAAWLDRLESEHDNLRAALRYLVQCGTVEDGLRLAGALRRFWSIRGHLAEGRASLGRLLALPLNDVRIEIRAKALATAGALAHLQGDYAAARSLREESLTSRREAGDRSAIAMALSELGDVFHQQGDYSTSDELHQESLSIWRELGDRQGIALALSRIGLLARVRGDYDAARPLYEEALALYRAQGNRSREAFVLNNLGRVAFYQGDYAKARALHEESLARRREVGYEWGIAVSLSDLGDALLQQGDLAAARSSYEESLCRWHHLGDRWGIAYAIEGFGDLAVAESLPERGVVLVAAATAARESIGAPRSPVARRRVEQLIEAAERILGEEAFAAAWSSGLTMPFEDAIEFAFVCPDG